MKQFIPMTDSVFSQPATFSEPLIPYQYGLVCFHGMRELAQQAVLKTDANNLYGECEYAG